MANFCGGIKLNQETFKIDKGIITMSDHTSDVANVVTPCGMLFDGAVFEVGLHDGKKILTSIGVDEEMDMPAPIKTNCGLLIDPRYFSVDEDGILNFSEHYILEVIVSPNNATIAVTYGAEATPVEPITGTTNLFALTETDEDYTVTVSAEGYTTQEQDVTADQNHIVEITLVATGG